MATLEHQPKRGAVDFHLKIDTIPGSSEHTGYEGQIMLDSFKWSMTQSTSFGASTGGGAGKVNVNDFHFTHHLDKASPKLMEACATGAHIATAVLSCQRAGGTGVVYYKLTFTDLIVSSVHVGGGDHTHSLDGIPMEEVSLSFASYKVDYQEQDNKGAKKGGAISHTFDIQKNKKG